MGRDKKKGRRERPSWAPHPVPEMGEDYEDILTATADLVERCGGRAFEIGYLHEDVPAHEAAWFAKAQFKGARLTAEDHPGPADAAFALAVRLLTGAKCKCGKLVQLVEGGALAYSKSRLAHGFGDWSDKDAAAAGQCMWRRLGDRWTPSCTAPPLTIPGGSR